MARFELINNCATCRHRRYYSGGQDECSLHGNILPSKRDLASGFPASCPLPYYPDIDALARENQRLREQLTQQA